MMPGSELGVRARRLRPHRRYPGRSHRLVCVCLRRILPVGALGANIWTRWHLGRRHSSRPRRMTLRTLMEPATAGDSADIRGAVSIRAI